MPDAISIISNINKLHDHGHFDAIFLTQDWHPQNHISFASTYKKLNIPLRDQHGHPVAGGVVGEFQLTQVWALLKIWPL